MWQGWINFKVRMAVSLPQICSPAHRLSSPRNPSQSEVFPTSPIKATQIQSAKRAAEMEAQGITVMKEVLKLLRKSPPLSLSKRLKSRILLNVPDEHTLLIRRNQAYLRQNLGFNLSASSMFAAAPRLILNSNYLLRKSWLHKQPSKMNTS